MIISSTPLAQDVVHLPCHQTGDFGSPIFAGQNSFNADETQPVTEQLANASQGDLEVPDEVEDAVQAALIAVAHGPIGPPVRHEKSGKAGVLARHSTGLIVRRAHPTKGLEL
jgi:hypothetical protein